MHQQIAIIFITRLVAGIYAYLIPMHAPIKINGDKIDVELFCQGERCLTGHFSNSEDFIKYIIGKQYTDICTCEAFDGQCEAGFSMVKIGQIYNEKEVANLCLPCKKKIGKSLYVQTMVFQSAWYCPWWGYVNITDSNANKSHIKAIPGNNIREQWSKRFHHGQSNCNIKIKQSALIDISMEEYYAYLQKHEENLFRHKRHDDEDDAEGANDNEWDTHYTHNLSDEVKIFKSLLKQPQGNGTKENPYPAWGMYQDISGKRYHVTVLFALALLLMIGGYATAIIINLRHRQYYAARDYYKMLKRKAQHEKEEYLKAEMEKRAYKLRRDNINKAKKNQLQQNSNKKMSLSE